MESTILSNLPENVQAKAQNALKDLSPEQQQLMSSVFENLVAQTRASVKKARRRNKTLTDEEKDANGYLSVVKSIINGTFSKPFTALPQNVRDHFVDQFVTALIDEPHPDLITEESIREAIQEGVESAYDKRPRHSEQAKLTILVKDAVAAVYTSKKLNESLQDTFIAALRQVEKIPNSAHTHKTKDQTVKELNQEADEKWESAIEDGKEAADKAIANREKSAKKAKAKRAAKKRKIDTEDGESDGESGDEAMEHTE